MKATRVETSDGGTWVLVFKRGDEAISELVQFAQKQRFKNSHFSAIGAFRSAVIGYFDWEAKDYRRIAVQEQVEVLSLTGFITSSEQGPKVHAHVTLGRRDGSAMGGHLLEGHVRPTLELVLAESAGRLIRKEDPETGLPLIDLSASEA